MFCQTCNNEKSEKFCPNCKKETSSAYVMKMETGKYRLIGGSLNGEIKRGEISWAYFPITYGIILTISIGIIQLLEIYWYYRIGLIIIFSILFFVLCFFDDHFRGKIVWLFSKSKEHIEKL